MSRIYHKLLGIFLLLSVFISVRPLFAQNFGVIEGMVVDRDTKQPIIGARIAVIGTKKGTLADIDGVFRIAKLAQATYQLEITALGYQPLIKTDISVGTAQSTKLRIELKVDAFETEAVIVTANKFFNKSEDTKVSSNELSQEEIRRAPGAAEDVSRMVQALPGVTTTADSRNDLIVRGGSPVENFIMIDGIEVPNINHFGSQGASGGPIGMVNVDFIQDVTFSAGGFPVKYGDRLSSIMDIRYRDGDKRQFTGKIDLGLAGAGFILEGPIQKEKSAYMISARKSYVDLVSSSTNITALPNYSNFNLKATYDINARHKLALIGLGGIDKITFEGENDEDVKSYDLTKYSAWQSVIGLSHKWLVGKSTYMQSSVSFNMYQKDITVDSLNIRQFLNESLDKEWLLRQDISHRFSPSDLVELGTQFRFLQNDNNIFIESGLDDFGVTRSDVVIDRKTDAFKFGGYLQYTKSFWQRFSLTTGLRYDYFDILNTPHALSPRASLSVDLRENLSLNLAYGLYQQAPPLIWLVGDEDNTGLKFMKTYQTVVGLALYPRQDIKFTVEVFHKNYSDYAASITNPEVSYASVGANFDTHGLEALTSKSSGYATGIEFFLQKKLFDDFYGLLNYSYAKIRFKALDGVERPSSFDFTNVFTAIFGYKFTESLEMSIKWRYMTGRPYTPVDLERSVANNSLILDNSRLNSLRHPDYHRLDIRLDKRYVFDGWNMVVFVDIQNVYNRQNVEHLIWDEEQNRVEKIYQWGFLPIAGLKIEF